ncbi:MAG: AbrB/MazE/SpoVT family DNA-binding domain-containing protein [Candidatus Omnitrophota bacterium]
MITSAKISAKRQVTVPLKVMLHLKLNPGDQLVFEEKNGCMEVKPRAEKFTIRDFVNHHRGSVSKKLTDDAIRQARMEAWQESGRP